MHDNRSGPRKSSTNGSVEGFPRVNPGRTVYLCGEENVVIEDRGENVLLPHVGGQTRLCKKVYLTEVDGTPLRSDPPPADAGARLVVRADAVDSKKVEWLWPGRIPYSFITIFAGRTGIGKSFVALDVAARRSRGDVWPDGEGVRCDPGNVLFFSEDPADFVLRPRLEAMGADLSRVFFATWEAMISYELKNTTMLDRLVKECEPELIIIDPPTNFLGDTDEHRNSEVRSVLMGIVEWLSRREKLVSVVLITQVCKAGKEEALASVLGSIAWTSTARIVHTFGRDQDGGCLFACPKSNIGPIPKSLAYAIVPRDGLAVVEWGGASELTADDIMSPQRGREPKASRREKAASFLIDSFRQKLEWPSEELFSRAAGAGISRSGVFEAKDLLRLPKARKVAHEWIWWVPPGWNPPLDYSFLDVHPATTENTESVESLESLER